MTSDGGMMHSEADNLTCEDGILTSEGDIRTSDEGGRDRYAAISRGGIRTSEGGILTSEGDIRTILRAASRSQSRDRYLSRFQRVQEKSTLILGGKKHRKRVF